MRGPEKTKNNAKRLRRDLTDAEQALWRSLRHRRIAGVKFRRQHPVGPYVLDFACAEKRLAIEVDGGQHAELTRKDIKRTEFLEARGWVVLRFWNNEVLENLEREEPVKRAEGEGPTRSGLPRIP